MTQAVNTVEELSDGWLSLLAELAVPEAAARLAFADLVAAYTAEGRYYHSLTHIRQVLATVDTLREEVAHLPAVLLAAWFHDVVYDPRAADNEEQSADYAGRLLAAWNVPAELIATVRALILATKHHGAADADSAVLLDADLATLGVEWPAYQRYNQAIRQEYAWVPPAEYRVHRARVLHHFLDRARIYHTDRMFAAREAQARHNLAQELAALAAGELPLA